MKHTAFLGGRDTGFARCTNARVPGQWNVKRNDTNYLKSLIGKKFIWLYLCGNSDCLLNHKTSWEVEKIMTKLLGFKLKATTLLRLWLLNYGTFFRWTNNPWTPLKSSCRSIYSDLTSYKLSISVLFVYFLLDLCYLLLPLVKNFMTSLPLKGAVHIKLLYLQPRKCLGKMEAIYSYKV